MDKTRNQVYKLEDLEAGDRFYFQGEKSQDVHEIYSNSVSGRTRIVKYYKDPGTSTKSVSMLIQEATGSKCYKSVIYLRTNILNK